MSGSVATAVAADSVGYGQVILAKASALAQVTGLSTNQLVLGVLTMLAKTNATFGTAQSQSVFLEPNVILESGPIYTHVSALVNITFYSYVTLFIE